MGRSLIPIAFLIIGCADGAGAAQSSDVGSADGGADASTADLVDQASEDPPADALADRLPDRSQSDAVGDPATADAAEDSGADSSDSVDAASDGGEPRTPKVLLIGLDGTRPDALALAHTPNIDALAAAGAFSDQAFAGDHTVSGPGWASILTGVWRDKHGIDDNQFTAPNVDEFPDLFTLLARARPDASSASVVSWDPIHTYIVTGADIVRTTDLDANGDAEGLAEALSILSSATLDPDVLFVYFGDIDVTGHTYGFHPRVPEYLAEIESVDEQVGQLVAAVHARPTFEREDWLVVMTTDHGGTPDGTHGQNIPEHRRIWTLLSGDRVSRGPLEPAPAQVDLVPTMLTYLGVDIDPAWGLDGRPRGLSSSSLPEVRFDTNLLVNGDAELDRPFADSLPDAYASGWLDPGGMTVVAYGSPGYPSVADPGPTQRGRGLFVGGAAATSSIRQVIDVSVLAAEIDAGRVGYELSGYLGGYAGQEDSAELTAHFLPAGALADAPQAALFFRDGSLLEYGVVADVAQTIPPADLAEAGWEGLWTHGPEAALNWADGKAYLFAGGQVARIDLASRQLDAGYPQAITTDNWPGLWPEGPEAAVNWGNGKAYFFRQGEYIRYDIASHTADAGYPLAVSSSWPGLDALESVDGAINWGNGKAYFFGGSKYVRYDVAGDQADGGYPRDLTWSTWPGVWPDGIDAVMMWPTAEDLVLGQGTIGPVTAAERTGSTGLLAREVTGAVPPKTRFIRVTLSAERVVGEVADGYADDLSFVLRRREP